ncbi:MAG: 1-deoxy-D-xylulose-5-phosphate reductoisomerase [Chloroflexi bacterium]|nr:1-deoxy-D-xylulose-5-phosphate reductoisomerase [Chloroflexota bacterium]
MKGIAVLGSTGSIGRQTLDVIRALPEEFKVVALAAGRNHELLAEQVQEFRPRIVWADGDVSGQSWGKGTDFVTMEEMAADVEVDVVMVATTGRAGLGPTFEAIRHGKAVALSNKEVIVMAGGLLNEAAHHTGAAILPVDSEPSAIWQCMRGEDQPVSKLIITASGGPFRKRPLEELAAVTAEQALQHPTWVMGQKITIDSSTLMNKGFEVIECHWLFQMPWDQIEVVVHPQSVIHSMVEFADGSVKAQLGPPDMRLPIQYALMYPDRVANRMLPKFDPLQHSSLTFEQMDTERYPAFKTAVDAGRAGGTFPAVLSAADEEVVHLFLKGKIGFSDINRLVCEVLDSHESSQERSIEGILAADEWARRRVGELVRGR